MGYMFKNLLSKQYIQFYRSPGIRLLQFHSHELNRSTVAFSFVTDPQISTLNNLAPIDRQKGYPHTQQLH
jgi:hypothetical protein